MATEITDWHDLAAVDDDPEEDYVLVNDLNEDTDGYAGTGDDWEPIGFIENDDNTREFNGTFDGQGHEIRDLIIDYDDLDDGDIGLFASTDEDSVIENLALTGSLTVTNADGTIYGGLVGNFYGVMRQCVCNVEVDVADGLRVGGMVGLNRGIIEDCYAVGDVLDGAARVGGLVGENVEIIRQSYTSCDVNGGSAVGALVGQNFDTIEESYFDGTPDNGEGTELDTDDMTGSDAPLNLTGLDFEDTWQTVESSDVDASDDGYPVLWLVRRSAQLQIQNIYVPSLTGRVIQDGDAENATVAAVNLDTDDLEGITTTDSNGRYGFDLSHLTSPPYELLVAVDFEDSGGDRFGRAKTILFDP